MKLISLIPAVAALIASLSPLLTHSASRTCPGIFPLRPVSVLRMPVAQAVLLRLRQALEPVIPLAGRAGLVLVHAVENR